MLQVSIPDREFYDEVRGEFLTVKGGVLQLEHSLLSLSKWEAKWLKPFLSTDNKTDEEAIDYIRCMTINQNVSSDIYQIIPDASYGKIVEYINAPMTATWFSDLTSAKSRDVITSEIIYYWMIAQNIPLECQKWHLNRLFTLIQVCNLKNQPPKKQGKKEMLSRRRALNEARRSQFKTKG